MTKNKDAICICKTIIMGAVFSPIDVLSGILFLVSKLTNCSVLSFINLLAGRCLLFLYLINISKIILKVIGGLSKWINT